MSDIRKDKKAKEIALAKDGPRLTCMRLAAWLVADRMTPHMPRPAMTPSLAVPAHAAKMKMHSLPYMEELSWSVRPAP